MRKILSLILFLMVPALWSMERLDGIAAVVGDSVITLSELEAYSLLRLNSMGIEPEMAGQVDSLQRQFLEELIDGKVLLVYAQKDTTIAIRNEDVDQAVEHRIQDILHQNSISLPILENELQKSQGISLAKFKSQLRPVMREQLLKQKVMQRYLSSIRVGRRDVENFYAQNKDSLPKAGKSVLLSKVSMKVVTPDSIRQAAYQRIRSIKERLNAGGDFVKLAQQHSEDPFAQSGGDLGFIAKGTLNELAFEEKAFSLAPGQVSDIFETRLGFHIITVVARKDKMVHVRQILIRIEPPAAYTDRVVARLDSVRTSAKTSADFVAAVKRLSDDGPSKSRSGSIGWKSLYELPSSVASAVDSLSEGDITSPLKEENSFVIYRIDRKVDSRNYTLEDDWDLIAEKTREIQAQQRLFDLVRKWRRDLFVDVRLK